MTNNNNLKLQVFSPNGLMFDDEIKRATISTLSGQLTFLRNHAPIVNGIVNNVVEIESLNKDVKKYICGWGLISMNNNILKIVVSFFCENTKENIGAILKKYEKSNSLLSKDKENIDAIKLKLLIINSLKKIPHN